MDVETRLQQISDEQDDIWALVIEADQTMETLSRGPMTAEAQGEYNAAYQTRRAALAKWDALDRERYNLVIAGSRLVERRRSERPK